MNANLQIFSGCPDGRKVFSLQKEAEEVSLNIDDEEYKSRRERNVA